MFGFAAWVVLVVGAVAFWASIGVRRRTRELEAKLQALDIRLDRLGDTVARLAAGAEPRPASESWYPGRRQAEPREEPRSGPGTPPAEATADAPSAETREKPGPRDVTTREPLAPEPASPELLIEPISSEQAVEPATTERPSDASVEKASVADSEGVSGEAAATPPSAPPPPTSSPPLSPSGQQPHWIPTTPTTFEEHFGTRWVVWVGGVALALGGIFLVQYSIERGWLVPAVRVLLGAIFATVLLTAGEWIRRRETRSNIAGVPAAYIPGILTAAGTIVAFATVYAAYALYGFLGPGSAFILLAVVALATLAVALLHGPALAGLGLAGAYVTPALVSTETPNYWALAIYLAVVGAAAFALASARRWRWLALAGVVLGALWTLPGIGDVAALPAHVFQVASGLALVAIFIVSGFLLGPDIAPGEVELESSGALSAYLLAAAALVFALPDEPLALIAFAVLSAGVLAIALRADSAALAVPIAGLLAFLVFVDWSSQAGAILDGLGDRPAATFRPNPFQVFVASVPAETPMDAVHVVIAVVLGGLFGTAGLGAQGRSPQALAPIAWSASGALVPIVLMITLYRATAGFERSLTFALAAFAVAILYSVATESLMRRAPRPGSAAASALYATAAVAALALALTFRLEKGGLSVGLALMVPGIAWISLRRPLPALRRLAALLVVIVMARTLWEPRIVGVALGTTPIFNWLLYGYGVPAAAFWLAGALLRRRADDVATRTAEAGAIVFTVLLLYLEIRHLVNGGDIYRSTAGLTELGLQVSAGLALAIGLERLRERTGSIVHDMAALGLVGAALAGAAFGLAGVRNPLWTSIDLGGPFLNLLLLAYLLPACLLATLEGVTRATRPRPYVAIIATATVAFAVLYLSLEVARLFRGPLLTAITVTDVEYYSYPVLWLACAIGLGWLLQRWRDTVHDRAAIALAALAILTIAVGLGSRHNLWTNQQDVGGLILNVMLQAYLAPAVLCVIVARNEVRPVRMWYRTTAAMLAVALALLYLTIEVTRFYRGPVLCCTGSDAEQYTYSAVWLVFGVLLLLAGILRASQPLRLASAAVVLVTVGKVFFVDLAGLTGGFRALSFIGLGLVLVGIGWLYQRLLFPRRRGEPALAAPPPDPAR